MQKPGPTTEMGDPDQSDVNELVDATFRLEAYACGARINPL